MGTLLSFTNKVTVDPQGDPQGDHHSFTDVGDHFLATIFEFKDDNML